MAANTVEDGVPIPDAGQSDGDGNASVRENIQSLWHEWLGLCHDRLHLAGLEVQRAGLSLASMVMAGILMANLLFGAWLGLLAVAVLGLVEDGVTAKDAILLAVALNFLLALVLVRVIRHKSHWLQFPATQRSFHLKSPGQRDAKKT